MSKQRLLDTNLIVGYLVQDHDKHARTAGRLFDAYILEALQMNIAFQDRV